MRATLVAALVATGMGTGVVPATAQESLDPKEWTVPWERTRPRDPIMDRSGRVWFVGQQGNYVAYLDARSGDFRQYKIEDGAFPHNINLDERDGVWFTGNRNGKLYSIEPATGVIKTIVLDSAVRDPHTMIWDKNGVAWFTAQQSNYVGRLERQTGAIKLWKTGDRTRPYGIVIDSKGQPWFDLFGTNKIGTIDLKTMELKEYTLPDERARPRRIALTADDVVWYGDYSRGYLGRVDPKTGAVEEWPMPSGARSLPYAMASDDRERIWLAETGVQPNRLVAFDAKSKTWVASIPVTSNGSSANTIRHMTFHRASREIWFGTDAGTIGAIKVPTEMIKLVP
jgi:virginiamycin B lyase